MIDREAINSLINTVKTIQDGVLKTMTDAHSKMGVAEKEAFVKALQDGGLAEIAKENAEKVIKLNEQFHKIKKMEEPISPEKLADFKKQKQRTDSMREEWIKQFKKPT